MAARVSGGKSQGQISTLRSVAGEEEVFIGDVGVGDKKKMKNKISSGGCQETFDGGKKDS